MSSKVYSQQYIVGIVNIGPMGDDANPNHPNSHWRYIFDLKVMFCTVYLAALNEGSLYAAALSALTQSKIRPTRKKIGGRILRLQNLKHPSENLASCGALSIRATQMGIAILHIVSVPS